MHTLLFPSRHFLQSPDLSTSLLRKAYGYIICGIDDKTHDFSDPNIKAFGSNIENLPNPIQQEIQIFPLHLNLRNVHQKQKNNCFDDPKFQKRNVVSTGTLCLTQSETPGW